jgi:hypothetical protein
MIVVLISNQLHVEFCVEDAIPSHKKYKFYEWSNISFSFAMGV